MKKILLLLMVFAMGVFSVQAQIGEFMIADFESVNNFLPGPYTSDGGPANVVTNTLNGNFSPGLSNTSANCLNYNRSGVQFPFLVMPLSGNAQDVASYRSFGAPKQFTITIWTTAPAGTTVQITLENKALATGPYPAGRQSFYTATTTTTGPGPTGSWEKLDFTYAGDIDGSVTNAIIDQMTFSFAPNTFVGQNVQIDNIAGFQVGSPPPIVNNEFLWTDFNGVDPVTYGQSDGTFTASVTNPDQGPNHLLTNVASYMRNAAAEFDVLALNIPAGSLQNVPNYTLGNTKFSLNVYSPAPGTNVSFTLQNKGLSLRPYPQGRYANFTGTTVGTGWERVTLNFGSTLNGCTITEINQLAIQFNSGTFTGTTVLLDSIFGPTIGAGPIVGENLLENFDAAGTITYRQAQSDGTFTDAIPTPGAGPGSGSGSGLIGQYVRNGGAQFDVLVGDLNGTVATPALYVNGSKKISMRVYTSAPVGSIVEFTLATAAASSSNYPTGRHSVYRAATEVQNGWQTLTFSYFFDPNSGADINQLQKVYIAFNANSFTNDTWFFDDIRGFALTPLVTAVTRDNLWSSLGGAFNSLAYTGADGALTQAGNPAVGPSNTQPTVARYVRSTAQFDVLRWKLNAPPTNFALYRSSANKFSIHVYSLLPTTVQFTLQNANAALGGYPTGRAAEFTGTHGGTGWEYVVLNYVGQPDASITNANIDELAVLFNANTTVSRTIFCDSIYGPQFTPAPPSVASVQWKGGGSTDWNDINNWSGLVANWFPGLTAGAGAVPTSGIAVVIPNGATPYPALSGTGPFNTGNLTISGSAFSLTNNNELTVNGNLVFSGAATPTVAAGSVLSVTGNITGGIGSSITGGGVLRVTGTNNQNIFGSVNVPNFTVSKTGGGLRLTTGNTLRITPTSASNGILNITGSSYLGNFAPVQGGGNVILGSNASGTAKMLINGSATYDGVITQERFVGSVGWHFVSLPFSTPFIGPTIGTPADFNEAGLRILPKNNANIFEYTENDATVGAYNGSVVEVDGWKVLNNLTTTGGPTKGYRVYCTSEFLGRGGVLATTGPPARNNITAGFTFTPTAYDGGGWNLIANPYSCEIDWSAVAFDPVGSNDAAPMGKFINTWNPAFNSGAGAYATFTATDATTGVGVNGGTQIVGSSQSFFIKATAGPSQITFREVHKVTNGGTNFLRQRAEENVLRIKLAQGTVKDEAAIFLHGNAAAGVDNMDALNLGSSIDVYSMPVAGQKLAIAAIPALQGQVEIPLAVALPAAGSASLELSGLETFATGTQVFLKDAFTNTLVPVTNGFVYPFSTSANLATKGEGRFTIVLAPGQVTVVKSAIPTVSINVYPNPAQDNISVAPSKGTAEHIVLRDVVGRVVQTWSGSSENVQLSVAALPNGVYTVQTTTRGGVFQSTFRKE